MFGLSDQGYNYIDQEEHRKEKEMVQVDIVKDLLEEVEEQEVIKTLHL